MSTDETLTPHSPTTETPETTPHEPTPATAPAEGDESTGSDETVNSEAVAS